MAKIVTKQIRFTPSNSPDVVTNKLYAEVAGTDLTYDSPSWDVGNVVETDGKVYVNLGAYLVGYDGNYDIGIAAIDDGGNEATMQVMSDVPLDFLAPNPVSGLELL
jgi:hypothetical protein